MRRTHDAVIDFETRSFADIKKTGAAVYAEDPTTEVLCLGYQLPGETEPRMWKHGDPPPLDLFAVLDHPNGRLIAHNALFERSIWRTIMVPQYGWPAMDLHQWYDTMASAAYKSMPLGLDKLCRALNLVQQKGASQLKYFKPDRNGHWVEPPESFYEYCRQDVRTEVEVHAALGDIPKAEMETWWLDQKINDRGVYIDMDYVKDCQAIIESASEPLLKEFSGITDGLKPTQVAKVRDWCNMKTLGVSLDRLRELEEDDSFAPPVVDLKADTIDALLKQEEVDDAAFYEADVELHTVGDNGGPPLDDLGRVDIPGDVRRALEIRKTIGSSSIKKLYRIPVCTCDDGRARGVVQYHGAGTGRWTGRLFQVQNFPRGTVPHDIDALVEAISTRDHETVELLYGAPVDAVISGLRHALVASPGKTLVVSDFSTIEARVVLAFAGQSDKVRLLREGGDIYLDMGSQIHNIPEMVTLPKAEAKEKYASQRQDGKNSVLGLGFQMGAKKFHDRYCAEQPLSFAEKVVRTYRYDWAPKVPELWYSLDDAIKDCVRRQRRVEVRDLCSFELYTNRFQHQWLVMELPSGRKLWYYSPRYSEWVEREWDPFMEETIEKKRQGVHFLTTFNGKMIRKQMFGGLATNNLVQGSARDLLVNGMHNCEDAGLPVVLTVHDEIVGEMDKILANKDLLDKAMKDVPDWAKKWDIPIETESWVGERYRK